MRGPRSQSLRSRNEKAVSPPCHTMHGLDRLHWPLWHGPASPLLSRPKSRASHALATLYTLPSWPAMRTHARHDGVRARVPPRGTRMPRHQPTPRPIRGLSSSIRHRTHSPEPLHCRTGTHQSLVAHAHPPPPYARTRRGPPGKSDMENSCPSPAVRLWLASRIALALTHPQPLRPRLGPHVAKGPSVPPAALAASLPPSPYVALPA